MLQNAIWKNNASANIHIFAHEMDRGFRRPKQREKLTMRNMDVAEQRWDYNEKKNISSLYSKCLMYLKKNNNNRICRDQ